MLDAVVIDELRTQLYEMDKTRSIKYSERSVVLYAPRKERMRTDQTSQTVNDTLLEHQKKQGLPAARDIEALIREQSGTPTTVRVRGFTRPEMGGSAGSYAFDADYDDGTGYRTHELFIRFMPFGTPVFNDCNFSGQFQILKALAGSGVPVPQVLYLDGSGRVLGTPGFIMKRLQGEVPPEYYRRGVLADATPSNRRSMVLDVVTTLAKLHQLDWRTMDVEFLQHRGEGNTYTSRDINWYWSNICWGCPQKVKHIRSAYQWLLDNQPAGHCVSLCHGDANLSNYMFHHNRVNAVLDWEFCFLGPPEFDLAYLLATTEVLTQSQVRPEGFPTATECMNHYETTTGNALENWDFAMKKAYFTIAINLWMGFRLLTAKHQDQYEPLVNYCLDKL